MLHSDRERWGFSVGQAAWRFGVSPHEYRELKAGTRWPTFDAYDLQDLRLAADVRADSTPMMNEPLLLSVREAALELGVGRDSCYALVREGRLEP